MKKSTVKRIISIVLMLAMLVTVTTVFSGCGLFTKKVVGTEAAKILLARERLDADYVGQKSSIVSFIENGNSSSGGFFDKLFGNGKISASVIGGISPLTASIAAGAKKLGNSSVEWYADDFKDASESKASYAQFISPIDDTAASTAELIATIKEEVGVTDKWVDTMDAKYMLIVEENSETIIEYYKPFKTISVSTRYTTDDAKCYYEMYTFIDYDDGTSGEIREKCIPGEYYEYMLRNTSGINDYFIADSSNGYWLTNRFSFDANSAYFSFYAIDGDIGYGSNVSVLSDFNTYSDHIDAQLFSPNSDRDIMTVSGNSGNYNISLYMTEIESGIDKLIGSSGSYSEEDYGHSGTVYLRGGGRGNDSEITVALSNGSNMSSGDTDGTTSYVDTDVMYNNFFGAYTYTAGLRFHSNAQSVEEAYDALVNFLKGKGIALKTSKSVVMDTYSKCEFLSQNFDVMYWNGYRMDSMENLLAAEDILKSDFDKQLRLYEDVKDYETVTWKRTVANNVDFGEMELVSKGTATYAGGSITVDGLTARTTDTKLLEEGGLYTLKVGLALRDGEGNISSINTVSLHSGNEATVTYAGDGLELSQTAEYTVPTALSEGEYIVVVYFATADEGIRVTEMFPVAFFSAEEGKLDSEFMDVTVKKSGENLFIDYEIKLSNTVVATMEKDSYTYDEIKTILLREVLAKGYPISSEKVQTESGEALNETGTYGEGVYRLKYLVNTSAGLVEAYMYCDLEAVHHS